MEIAIGADHAGFKAKIFLIAHLESKGYGIHDVGTDSVKSVDYPHFAHAVGKMVIDGHADKGIVICGTGIGVSISANKIPGVRAALCSTNEDAEMSRKHNNSNVLALGARSCGPPDLVAITDTWLNTAFEGGRHERRVNQIENINI
ncbi:MAG: ribose 5-phosphate isomerase B [Candidatus Marinimicrobia bacterium]|jgi:ribose 5-phosphate isomerase B|nr:ribose 5-phosphate isomerase B [Candidatus Neomarinimicrobiota bacterium]MBT3633637.1 ribose 5-phosphate isomerase B [Candidatus Neomarinimicrobiota bacterium]MBT3682410.1 ribose 5-phosphate isomerase B [Candidatus Neomarinimicrobiota bacterium]MBT3759174.1 ribose 5-phosphate isomerase B [Candidatus Neomarinimicrobiota bacterium]MBT3895553.1 ribose 5-phosphate isomerase B [Candidatus Neomarinimicrobiota bacterium]